MAAIHSCWLDALESDVPRVSNFVELSLSVFRVCAHVTLPTPFCLAVFLAAFRGLVAACTNLAQLAQQRSQCSEKN